MCCMEKCFYYFSIFLSLTWLFGDWCALGSLVWEFGEFVSGMAIREWLTSAKLAMPFTNVREWSGRHGSFVNGDGSWVALNNSTVLWRQEMGRGFPLLLQRVAKCVVVGGPALPNVYITGDLPFSCFFPSL